jgi:hypothetical protein
MCATAKTFHPHARLEHLYHHLLDNGWLTDILECDDLDTSVHSADVRRLLAAGDPKWKTLVPPAVRRLIEERQLFGYRPER